jgi:arylsulfatase A-like enzyme
VLGRRALLAVVAVALLLATAAPAVGGGRPAVKPDIVVVMVDDVGDIDHRLWNRLPAIRRIFVHGGLEFTEAYVETPLCCPSRAGFLTGLHTHHHGVIDNDGRLLDPSNTLATALDDVGYHTLIVGKYLNGTDRLDDTWPPGWDHAAVNGGKYYDYTMWVDGVAEARGSTSDDYSTTVLERQALTWLRAAPPDQPLFAYLAPFAPHTANGMPVPVSARQDDGAPRCADVPPWRPPNYNEADVSDKPLHIQERAFVKPRSGWPLVETCETLLAVDRLVASVETELRLQGRLRNTVWVLASDNGMGWGQHRWRVKWVPFSTATPLFMAGRGVERGTTDALISLIDLPASLARLAGASMGQIDGRSFVRRGLRIGPVSGRDRLLEQFTGSSGYVGPWRAIRTRTWHWVEYDTGERELYDLVTDPFEMENLAGTLPEVEADLAAQLQELLTEAPRSRRDRR